MFFIIHSRRFHVMSYRLFWLPILLMVSLIIGCSGNSSPIETGIGQTLPDQEVTQAQSNNTGRTLLGYYQIAIDTETLEAEVTPLRTADFNLNLIPFLGPPLNPLNLITIQIDPFDSAPEEGIFAVDMTIQHPFPGLTQYPGFDLRCIFMSEGTVLSEQYDGLIYADSHETTILNADGWTRWWNPTEFTNYGMILGYCEGTLSIPGYYASATLNPYKYFALGIEAEDELIIDPETRGVFHPIPGYYTRRMMIKFEMEGDAIIILFNTAVDCSWDEPSGDPPDFDIPDDFSLSANTQEAYQLKVENAGSTAWYTDPGNFGGDLKIDLTVYDWQSMENPAGILGEINAIWVESPDLFDTPIDILPTATIFDDGPTSSVFHFEILDVAPTATEDQRILIAVESANPDTYAPNTPGDWSTLGIPDGPLAAYFLWDVPVYNEEPTQIPAPTDLEAEAIGKVVYLTWNHPGWPSLAGYNLYRKESTEPSYNFSSPLNSILITDMSYEDTEIDLYGTVYNYVVKAVDTSSFESVPSNEATAYPLFAGPTGLYNITTPGICRIYWDDSAWPTLEGYNVYRKINTDPDFDFGTPLNGSILTVCEYIDDTILIDGTKYDYVVKCIDEELFESLPSDVMPANIFDGPTGVGNCEASEVIKVYWDEVFPDPPQELNGYNIYRKLPAVFAYDFTSPINPDPFMWEWWADANVTNGETYDYIATWTDTDGNESLPSAQTSGTPYYTTPTGFTDLENPDGVMGSGPLHNISNLAITLDGKIALVWDFGPRFVWGDISDGSYGSTIYLGSYGYGQNANVAVDTDGFAHVVWTNQYDTNRTYWYARIDQANTVEYFEVIHTCIEATGWEGESGITVTPDGEVHMALPSYDGSTYSLQYVHGYPGDFSDPELITTDVYQMLYHMRPELDSDPWGRLHIAFTGPGTGPINYMMRDTDGTWTSPVNVASGISSYNNFCDLQVDFHGVVHIAWRATATQQVAYANNRSGSWNAITIPGSSSVNFIGVACDQDGNAYMDWYSDTLTVDSKCYGAMVDNSMNYLETSLLSDDQPYRAAWCSMSGMADPCYASDTAVFAVWKLFPNSTNPLYARIRTDY